MKEWGREIEQRESLQQRLKKNESKNEMKKHESKSCDLYL